MSDLKCSECGHIVEDEPFKIEVRFYNPGQNIGEGTEPEFLSVYQMPRVGECFRLHRNSEHEPDINAKPRNYRIFKIIWYEFCEMSDGQIIHTPMVYMELEQ